MLKPSITASFTLHENFVKKFVNLNHGWHHYKPRIIYFPLPKFVSTEPKSDAKNGRLCSGDLQTNKQKTVCSLDHVLFQFNLYNSGPNMVTKQQNNTRSRIDQGTFVPNMNFIGPQIAELLMYVSVAIVTRLQQNNTQSRIGPRNLCTKYERYRPSNSRVIMCVSVAMVTRLQQNNTQSRIGPRTLCTKYEQIGPQLA